MFDLTIWRGDTMPSFTVFVCLMGRCFCLDFALPSLKTWRASAMLDGGGGGADLP